jgi:hypothetical protein
MSTMQHHQHGQMGNLSAEMHECIENCEMCHHACIQTMSHCLEMGGKHAEASHIRLMMDCAQICHTSEDFMMRNSEFHPRTCAVCAEVCMRCAEDCERIGPNDVQMKQCAEICRRCAESCRKMASARAA